MSYDEPEMARKEGCLTFHDFIDRVCAHCQFMDKRGDVFVCRHRPPSGSGWPQVLPESDWCDQFRATAEARQAAQVELSVAMTKAMAETKAKRL